jgi:hypothetical protein
MVFDSLDIQPHTDNKYEALPHVHLIYDFDWDPSFLDQTFNYEYEWVDLTYILQGTLLDYRLKNMVNIVAAIS